jgi:Lon protease-like protein
MDALPMFPLGSVLVPGMVLPLHVFEDRYRTLVRDCLAGTPEFGVALIERGSEVGGGDIRSTVGTVARIAQAEEFPDGRWGLLCVGTRRVKVLRWVEDDPYPRADVEDWHDPEPGSNAVETYGDAVQVLRRVLALASELGEDVVPATVELSDDPVVGSYQIVAVAPFGPADRQDLLAARTVEQRLSRLLAMLHDELAVLEQQLAWEPPELDPGDDTTRG